jgi:hypothetical protein
MKKTLRITGAVMVMIAAYFAAAAISGLVRELSAQQLCTVMDYSGIGILFMVLLLIAFALLLLFQKDEN